jgi:hypothetical protein
MSTALEVLIAAYLLYRKSSEAFDKLDLATIENGGWVTWCVVLARIGYLAVVSSVCVIAGWIVILKGLPQ